MLRVRRLAAGERMAVPDGAYVYVRPSCAAAYASATRNWARATRPASRTPKGWRRWR